MLNSQGLYEGASASTRQLTLAYHHRTKSRQRTMLDDGDALALDLPRGTILRGGQRLLLSDGSIAAVCAAPEQLIESRCDTLLDVARAAYHLGNRHVAVEVGGDDDGAWLRLAADHVLEDMLVTLGCAVRSLVAAFEPEAGAYAGGHSHSHSHSHDADQPKAAMRLHEFGAVADAGA